MNDAVDTVVARRRHLVTSANPGERHDYVVRLDGAMAVGDAGNEGRAAAVTLLYVPDRLVLSWAAFDGYLRSLGASSWPTVEELALVLLADANNELIPRWVRIRLTTVGSTQSGGHGVVVEDRQPGWENPSILERLPTL